MERIAAISVGISVCVMILTLAVIFGFKSEVTNKMVGLTSEAIVTDVRNIGSMESIPMDRNHTLDSVIMDIGGVTTLAPYVTRGCVARTNGLTEGVLIKGVDSLYDTQFLSSTLIQGELPDLKSDRVQPQIAISRNIAQRFDIGVDSTLEIFLIGNDRSLQRREYTITGIYDSGLGTIDQSLIITDIRNAQNLSSWDSNQISGFEVSLSSSENSALVCEQINRAITRLELTTESIPEDENPYAISVEELYPYIFDWLKVHDVNAVVIIVIMIIVAFFSMTSALLIIVMERTRMIGLLKAVGMNNHDIRSIFVWRAAHIILRGLIWGNVIGVGLSLLQQWTKAIKLDAEGYILSAVPIDISLGWLLILNIGIIFAILILLIAPTSIITRIRPDEALRYE